MSLGSALVIGMAAPSRAVSRCLEAKSVTEHVITTEARALEEAQ